MTVAVVEAEAEAEAVAVAVAVAVGFVGAENICTYNYFLIIMLYYIIII